MLFGFGAGEMLAALLMLALPVVVLLVVVKVIASVVESRRILHDRAHRELEAALARAQARIEALETGAQRVDGTPLTRAPLDPPHGR